MSGGGWKLPLSLSVLFVAASFAWQGRAGFSLADEGFLWYGAQRVMQGEVPIRDFMSYDPARYYWSAALMSALRDDGILSLRTVVALFQALGLWVGVALVSRSVLRKGRLHWLYLSLCAATLLVWMFPRHKLFDASISVLLTGALAFLVADPTPRRQVLAGTAVGLAAVFGRNHGLYGAVASLGIMVWLGVRSSERLAFAKSVLRWSIGVVLGYLPVLLMLLLVPGFSGAFRAGLHFLASRGSTNLALPIPWPWGVHLQGIAPGEAVRAVSVGALFVGLIAFGVSTLAWVTYRRFRGKDAPPVLVATAFLSLPYAHYAYSRADVGHLALGIFPMVIGGLCLASGWTPPVRWALAAGMCALSLFVMLVQHPGWQCRGRGACVDVAFGDTTLRVDRGTAGSIALLRQLSARYAPAPQTFLAVPFWPGAYALLERRSPTWAIYPLWKRGAAFEQREIEALRRARPGFVIVNDAALDGREERRFRTTHPLVYRYIQEAFVRSPRLRDASLQLYLPRGVPE